MSGSLPLHLFTNDPTLDLIVGLCSLVAICFISYLCTSQYCRENDHPDNDLEQQWKQQFIENVRDYRANEEIIASSMQTPDYDQRWAARRAKGAGKATC